MNECFLLPVLHMEAENLLCLFEIQYLSLDLSSGVFYLMEHLHKTIDMGRGKRKERRRRRMGRGKTPRSERENEQAKPIKMQTVRVETEIWS